MLEHVKFLSLMQAILTDRSENDDVKKLNELLAEYGYLMDPKKIRKRDDFAKKAGETMDIDFKGFESFIEGMSNG